MPSITMAVTMVNMAAIMVVTMEVVTMAAAIMVAMGTVTMDMVGDMVTEKDTAITATIENIHRQTCQSR